MAQAIDDSPALEPAPQREGLVARGSWTVRHHDSIGALVAAAAPGPLDISGVARLDTFGMMQLVRLAGDGAQIKGVPEAYHRLFTEVTSGLEISHEREPSPLPLTRRLFDPVGDWVVEAGRDAAAFADLWGRVLLAVWGIVRGRNRLRPLSFVAQLQRVALNATPIIVLITFLIGAIIGQQGIFHFRKFGAETYVVDMVSILTLREIGVLIVAIMVAGRTGSAYTAELGSMKMREEVDALTVMGLDPISVLVVPRIAALVVGLPLLTILGDFAAIAGGAIVAQFYGGIPLQIFLQRMQEAISLSHVWVGLAKAPFMALIIGMVACIEGLRVRGSAESLGEHTTASVVKAIFMVIIMDGLFAMLFAAMDV